MRHKLYYNNMSFCLIFTTVFFSFINGNCGIYNEFAYAYCFLRSFDTTKELPCPEYQEKINHGLKDADIVPCRPGICKNLLHPGPLSSHSPAAGKLPVAGLNQTTTKDKPYSRKSNKPPAVASVTITLYRVIYVIVALLVAFASFYFSFGMM